MADQRVRTVLFGSAFFVVISATILASRHHGGLALVWFGTAIGIGWLTSIERKEWPVALVAMAVTSALATSLFGFGLHMALPFAVVNVFEISFAALLLLAARPQRDWLNSIAGLSVLILVCGAIAPATAGLFGALAANTAAPGGVLYHFESWLTGHALGTLIGFPIVHFVINALSSTGERDTHPARPTEFVLHMAAILVVSFVALDVYRLPLLFLPIVPLMFAALRCGRAGSAIGIVIIGTVAVISLDRGASDISNLAFDMRGKLFFLQFYLATLTLLAIPCSVALRQYRMVLEELAYRKAVNRLITENSDDALVNLDEQGTIRFSSCAGERFTGISELEGHHLEVFFDPLDAALVREAIEDARMNPVETVVLERPVMTADGDERWLEAKLRTATSNSDGLTLRGFAVTIRDVTERKRTELDAIEASETDALTALPNRRLLLRQLDRALAIAGQRPLAFAIVDLDHFKAVNDAHGHVFGDDVLRAVARVMRGYVTPTRSFARLGGEEFALIDIQPDFASSEALCEELRGAIAAIMPRAPDGVPLSITASIGLKRIDKPIGVTEAMQATDALLYRAKHNGRNRVESSTAEGGQQTGRRAAA